ncbi:Larval cuticle protein LCP-17 [Armadillidium vulgare]|nr:Larval cuticle protein LCP-17 [Armadillidium vulgare]
MITHFKSPIIQIIFVCFLAVAIARPDDLYRPQSSFRDDSDEVLILRDDRVHPEEGHYSFDFETADGIRRSESGSPLNIENNPTGQQGVVSFTFPNGEHFELKFVANDGGYQPESPWLPVAPAFPHPIPQFVLDQIAKAEREDAEAARALPSRASPSRPRSYYGDDSDEKK